MSQQLITPSIGVTIGQQTRLYHAFITTALPDLDAPSTVTLYAGPLRDVVDMAADPCILDHTPARKRARLILIDTTELSWQKARCRGHGHRLAAADAVLVGLNTLQAWLWQRIQTPGRVEPSYAEESTKCRCCANSHGARVLEARARDHFEEQQHDTKSAAANHATGQVTR